MLNSRANNYTIHGDTSFHPCNFGRDDHEPQYLWVYVGNLCLAIFSLAGRILRTRRQARIVPTASTAVPWESLLQKAPLKKKCTAKPIAFPLHKNTKKAENIQQTKE